MKPLQAIIRINKAKTILIVLLFFSLQTVHSQSVPLPNGFAHNDYRHRHPLFDALQNGYTNIEADVFLRRGKLIVAHIDPFFKSRRTLESLYLRPLAARITNDSGQVYRGYATPVILMIDIKTNSDNTYAAIKVLLEKYRNILSSYDHGQVRQGEVTVVLSGHKPYHMIENEDTRLAFIDEDLRKTYQDTTNMNVYKMSSCKYSNLLKWKGNGTMPDEEQNKLCAYVSMAHKYGKKVRLWASPENNNVWNELLKCGVDLINTDKLVRLKDFLIGRKQSFATANAANAAPKKSETAIITL